MIAGDADTTAPMRGARGRLVAAARPAVLAAAAVGAAGLIAWAQYRAGMYPAPLDIPGTSWLDEYLTRTFARQQSLAFAIPLFAAGGVAFALSVPRLDAAGEVRTPHVTQSWWPAVGLAGGIAWFSLIVLLATGRYEPWYRWLFVASAVAVGVQFVSADLRGRLPVLRRPAAITLIELAAVAALIGAFIGINARDLDSWRYAAIGDDGSFYEFASRILRGETMNWFSQAGPYGLHPVLSSAYQAFILRVLGDDLFGWKMASVIAIAVSIALVYWVAAELFSSRVGLFAAMFTAVSHYLFAYAHTGYNNIFSLAPTIAAIACLASGLKRGSSSLLFAAGACAGLGFYTYYSSRATIGIIAVAVILAGARTMRPGVIAPIILGFVMFTVPIFAVDGRDVLDAMLDRSASSSSDPPLTRAFDNLGRTFFAFNYNPDNRHYAAGPLMDGVSVTLAVAGLAVALSQLRVYGHRVVCAWFVIAAVVAGVFSEYTEVSISRMHYALPCVAIFAAIGLDRLIAAMGRVAWPLDSRLAGIAAVMLVAPPLFWMNGDRFFNDSARRSATTPESVILRELTSSPCSDTAAASIVYAEGPVLPVWWRFFGLDDRRPVHIRYGLAATAYEPYPLTGGTGCVLIKDNTGDVAPIVTRLDQGGQATGQPYVSTATDLSRTIRVTRATPPGRMPIRPEALAAAWRTLPDDDTLSRIVKAKERDALPPIDDPGFVAADAARAGLYEPVIVVEGTDAARAYPLSYLITTGVVNDTIDGVPIAVTFDAISAMPQVFQREAGGRVLNLALTGMFLDGNALLYDRETETWWQQGTGQAVAGELMGRTLAQRPFTVASLGSFRSSYRNAQILAQTSAQGENPYRGYDSANGKPLFFDGSLDERLRPMQRVLVMETPGGVVAAPLPDDATQTRAHVAKIGGEDVALFFDGGVATPLQESYPQTARVVGSVLPFKTEPGFEWRRAFNGDRYTTRFADQQERVWNIFGGQVTAAGIGEQMQPIRATQGFWFAVSALYPGIEIVTLE